MTKIIVILFITSVIYIVIKIKRHEKRQLHQSPADSRHGLFFNHNLNKHSKMKKLIENIKTWFTRRESNPEKRSLREMYQESHPEAVKPYKPGSGQYFTNNRKRTRGRNIQYVVMPNGSTRVIRHETV